jgi:Protein of unknown function (DUF3822)
MSTSDSQPIDLSLSGINPYNLVISLSPKETLFSIYDQEGRNLSFSKSTTSIHNLTSDEIISVFNDVIESKLLFQTVRIVFESNIYTLVPNDLFRKENIRDFLEFQFDIPKQSLIQFNLLSQFGAINVYAIPASVEKSMSSLFPKVSIEHHLSYFITDRLKSAATNIIAILIRDLTIDILVLTSGKPQLLNTFQITTTEDVVYYALKIYEQFSLDLDKVGLYLYNTKPSSDYSRQLNLYIKNVTCE